MPSNLRPTFSAELSSIIRFIRFPLMFCVVLMHTHLPLENDLPQTMVKILFPRVPIYFLISAYLFFYSFKGWEWSQYRGKLHRRIFSLLVPYLLCNLFTILFYYLVHRIASGIISPDFENIKHFGMEEWIRAFWNKTDGHPIAYQLWFLRDLMIMNVFTPMFFLLLNGRIGNVVIILLILNALFGLTNIQPLNSITWFSVGAYLALHNIDVVDLLKKSRYVAILLFVIFSAATLYSNKFAPYSLFFGVFAVLDVVRLLVNKGIRMPALLTEVAFFLYLFHGCTIMIITKMIVFLSHDNQVCLTIGYFLTPVLMTIVCVIIYSGLKRLFPTFTNILVGRRMKAI